MQIFLPEFQDQGSEAEFAANTSMDVQPAAWSVRTVQGCRGKLQVTSLFWPSWFAPVVSAQEAASSTFFQSSQPLATGRTIFVGAEFELSFATSEPAL